MSGGYAVEEAVYIPQSLRKKQKKPNFFKRLLHKWTNEVNNSQDEKLGINLRIDHNTTKIDSDKGIRFQVYKATGGFVVETSMYDRQRDRHHNSLHIITDDQDLGAQIGKIITMEALKQ
jgi:hypothetical protein